MRARKQTTGSCTLAHTQINEKREQYRPVATRGSVLYFCMVEASLICWMYNSSLAQFLEQFDLSVFRSEKTQPTHKRVEKIVEYLTHQVRLPAMKVPSRDKDLLGASPIPRTRGGTRPAVRKDHCSLVARSTSLQE